MKHIIALLFILATTSIGFSQTAGDNPDSLLFRDHAYAFAASGYRALLKKNPNDAENLKKLGDCYRHMMYYDSALSVYAKAIDINGDCGQKTGRFYYGLMLKSKVKYEDAQKTFESFLSSGFEGYTNNGKTIYTKQQLEDRAKVEIEGCKMGVQAMSNKSNLEKKVLLRNLGVSLNSPNSDFAPMYYEDTSVIVFTTTREGTKVGKVDGKTLKKYGGNDEPFSDIHEATLNANITFKEVSAKQFAPMNSNVNDGTTAMTADGLTLYITICNGGDGKSEGCHIYRSVRKDTATAWSKPEIVKEIAGGFDKKGRPLYYDTQPALTADGKTLYFASDRPGTYGELDIFYSTWDGSKWNAAKNAGPMINTLKNDQFPNYDSKEGILYYSSNGLVGFGGLDLFKAKGSNDQWQKPENMGYPINSPAEDLCYVVNPKNPRTGFMVSNRSTPDSYGNMPVGKTDIYYYLYTIEPYEVTLLTSVTNTKDNTPVTSVTGSVKTQSGIDLGTINTDVSGTTKIDISQFINDKKVKTGDILVIQIGGKDGFNDATPNRKEITVGEDKKQDLKVSFVMTPKEVVIPKVTLALHNIYFDFNKYDIREEATKTLDSVADILAKFPTVTLLIAGHTDAVGTDQRNTVLGQNRAKAAIAYLTKKGIDAKRLVSVTKGEGMPIAENELGGKDNPDGRTLNRRVEFIILGDNYDKARFEIYNSNKGTATDGKISKEGDKK